MNKGIRVLVLLLAALAVQAVQAETTPLRIGILPTLSARVLLTTYAPLREYLERELRRPVEMRSATGFRDFQSQTQAGEFDAVVTAAHLARLLQRDNGWTPLVTHVTANRAVLLIARDRPLNSVQELRGKMVAFPDRLALVVLQTTHWLREQGLQAGRDYQIVDATSFNSAAYAVQQHQAMLAVSSPATWKQLPDALKNDLVEFTNLPEIPALTWIAHPRMGADAEVLRRALLRFTVALPEGKQFFDTTGYRGYREVTDADTKALSPYIDELKALLGQGK
jgi:phosphonate transport system substrate-binding protein